MPGGMEPKVSLKGGPSCEWGEQPPEGTPVPNNTLSEQVGEMAPDSRRATSPRKHLLPNYQLDLASEHLLALYQEPCWRLCICQATESSEHPYGEKEEGHQLRYLAYTPGGQTLCVHVRVFYVGTCVRGLCFVTYISRNKGFLVNCSKKRANQMGDEQNWGVPGTEETGDGGHNQLDSCAPHLNRASNTQPSLLLP